LSAGKDKGISDQVESRLDDIFADGGGDSAEKFDDSSTVVEVSSRLDDIFGREDEKPIAPIKKASANPPVSAKKPENKPPAKAKADPAKTALISDLKSVVLALEWEITDQVMQKLGEEIAKLEVSCKEDKIILAFLQLLGSLGKYIQKKRAEAHPESINLLHSVYENLETVMLSQDLNDAAKKKMLVTQVNKYKVLKEQISVQKPSEKEEEKRPEKPVIPTRIPEEKISPIFAEEPSVISPIAPSYMMSEEADMEIGIPRKTGDEAFAEGTEEIIRAVRELQQTIKEEFSALRAELKLWREKR
jgi:hypothetical protein